MPAGSIKWHSTFANDRCRWPGSWICGTRDYGWSLREAKRADMSLVLQLWHGYHLLKSKLSWCVKFGWQKALYNTRYKILAMGKVGVRYGLVFFGVLIWHVWSEQKNGGTPAGDSKVHSDPENLWKFRIASNVAGLTGKGISSMNPCSWIAWSWVREPESSHISMILQMILDVLSPLFQRECDSIDASHGLLNQLIPKSLWKKRSTVDTKQRPAAGTIRLTRCYAQDLGKVAVRCATRTWGLRDSYAARRP